MGTKSLQRLFVDLFLVFLSTSHSQIISLYYELSLRQLIVKTSPLIGLQTPFSLLLSK